MFYAHVSSNVHVYTPAALGADHVTEVGTTTTLEDLSLRDLAKLVAGLAGDHLHSDNRHSWSVDGDHRGCTWDDKTNDWVGGLWYVWLHAKNEEGQSVWYHTITLRRRNNHQEDWHTLVLTPASMARFIKSISSVFSKA